MTLADARALVPDLTAADAESAADTAILATLADWCSRYSPWSAIDGADGIRLDITGVAHLFGGEAALLADAEKRLVRLGFTVRGAIADTPAASWAWARYRQPQADPILPEGDTRALLALPVATLRLERETVLALGRLGLREIGTVAALPRAPLAQRLGEPLMRRLDQFFGRAAEPISPRKLAESWIARLIFAEPIGRREDCDEATLRLVTQLCGKLAREGQGARRLELAFYRVDASVQRLAIGTSRPTHAPSHVVRLFAERLETIDPGFGIEAVALEATEVEALAPLQGGLDSSGGEGDLAALVDRLQNRLGRGRVLQLVPVESHVPERAEMRVPALSSGPSLSHLRGRGTAAEIPLPAGEGGGRISGRVRGAVRPIKLLAPPEPIEAMAPIPDDPPFSFRWRRVLHRVAHADGPERIGPEWWKPNPGRPRDYYRVEDTEGRRFWVYREGLYDGRQPPRWFLHGFFA